MTEPLLRRLIAEGLGSAFLLATVIGSGVMGGGPGCLRKKSAFLSRLSAGVRQPRGAAAD